MESNIAAAVKKRERPTVKVKVMLPRAYLVEVSTSSSLQSQQAQLFLPLKRKSRQNNIHKR